MNHRLFHLILSLWFVFFFIFMVMVTSKEISKERNNTYLNKHGVVAQAVLVEKTNGTAGSIILKYTYEVENRTFDIYMNNSEIGLRVGDSVAIKYDKHNPRDYVIKGYEDSNIENVISAFSMTLVAIIFMIVHLNTVIKIGYLENKGKRVLCGMESYSLERFPLIRKIKCNIPGNNSKTYKGHCGFRIEEMMTDNSLKYIPMYVSKSNQNIYYVHCDELREIVNNKHYKGYTIEELQGL